jgi:hypothetical protein
MNTFPLALSQKLEGEGKGLGGWRGEVAIGFGMRSRVALRPAGQDSFTWPRAARRDEPPIWLLAVCYDA